MVQQLLKGPAARGVAAVSLAAVFVIAAAVGLTIWRYEDALSRAAVALDAHGDATLTQALVATFWQEHEAMNEYFIAPSPAVSSEVSAEQTQFAATSGTLGASQTPVEARLREQAAAANTGFYALFTRVQGVAGTTPKRELLAVRQLGGAETSVLGPLNGLDHAQAHRADTAQAAASSAASQARDIGVAAAILIVLVGLTYSFFTLRLLGRSFEREQELKKALRRLNELLDRLRSTSGVLGEVTAELRLAAKTAAAVTSEQSSAVAETSATIEELAATAGSIADNAHAMAKAAERTGDTMRDMREKVEAIAARALSLGERAQKIGEILV
jgi:methyl-accepting chemotaxis protein